MQQIGEIDRRILLDGRFGHAAILFSRSKNSYTDLSDRQKNMQRHFALELASDDTKIQVVHVAQPVSGPADIVPVFTAIQK